MPKKIILGCLCAIVLSLNAHAFVRYTEKVQTKLRDVNITGFVDYAPFGAVEHPGEPLLGRFDSIWKPMILQIQKENNLKISYDLKQKYYENLVQKVRRGEIDLILGAYHETELYRGLELIFPSIINNPVTVFMLPNRISDVKSTDDLKKLKGVRLEKEVYSDFVEQQLQEYNIEKIDTPYNLFEKLFTKQADYILISQYAGLIEAYKLGLREQISISKQALWNIPLFIGISKISPHRKLLAQKLTHYAKEQKNRDAIKELLIKTINDIGKKYEGVVPPTFVTDTPTEETSEQ